MYQSSKVFNRKPVKDLSTDTKKHDLSKVSPLIRTEYYEENGKKLDHYLDHFFATQDTANMDSLVIGYWSDDYDLGSTGDLKQSIDYLVKNKDKMPALNALFIGSIGQEESEISWIGLTDLEKLINHHFELEYFRARGDGNFLGEDLSSTHLKKLALETGGLSSTTLAHVLRSNLPNLEHLELWIGSEYYGNTTLEHVKPLLDTKQFPKLRYLGLRNCDFADELAVELANAPILDQIDVLDLSLGSLGNKGAEALAQSEMIGKLDKLIVDHHYIDDEVIQKLKNAVKELSHDDKQVADFYDGEEERYIFVSE